jgi:hypothetical protein
MIRLDNPEILIEDLMKFADFNKDGKVSNENKIVYLNKNISFVFY